MDSREFERAYLGSALIDPSVIIEYPIDTNDLYYEDNRAIYIAMKNVLDRHGKLDFLLLQEEFGNPAQLADLLNSTVSALNADAYAAKIRKAAEARDIMAVASKMANDAAHGELDTSGYIERITNAIRVTGTTDDLKDAADNYVAWMQQREENPSDVWGIPSPWDAFNRITGGLHKKESTLIFGKSGVGKTVAVLQMGYHAACHGYRVDFYELEMSKENLISRLVAMKSRVPTDKVNSGKLTDIEKHKVLDAVEFVKGLPIRISDATHWTSQEIRADQQKRRERADMVIVDYLALLQDKADNAYERVEGAAKTLRQMAKDLDQVVLTVGSQVKDGSIKGTAEVKYTQDMTWFLEQTNDDVNDPCRDLVPDKLRNIGEFRKVALVFDSVYDGPQKHRLPKLEAYSL